MTYSYIARTSFAGYTRGHVLSPADAAKYGGDPKLTIRVVIKPPPAASKPSTTAKA